jgi:twitching motility protein PilT
MELTPLLTKCVELKGSDLHLSAGLVPIMRIDGELVPLKDSTAIDPEAMKTLVYSVMEPELRSEFETSLEADFAMAVPSVARFRVNALHENNGISAVFRVIPEKIPTMEELHLPPIFKQLVDLPNGLILVTGPTGSGKSTTLAAMINYINENQAVHIITIEDPIEFTHTSKKSLVRQRQIHRDTHDFSAALRSALREDPDVILLGEMRDLETIRLALTAAETGHLVFATLHTSSAPRSINRIVDVFPAGEKDMIRNMLSESLQAVVCQTLLKKVGGGRAAALEIMRGTPAVRNLIREDKIAQMMTTIQTGGEVGMCTLDQSLQALIARGEIDQETAMQVALNKELFRK